MRLEMFFYFDGNCREAVEFYAKVFKTEVRNLMTYGEAPTDPNNPIAESDINRIVYAGILLDNMTAMFSDLPSSSSFKAGNNISPTISTNDKEEIRRIFSELSEGGEVYFELAPTFFSELFGMVTDKFGIRWQILFYEEKV
ncbi:MAG: VOC family protein [Candidatus Cloacimonetes bacterium]|nr:VOC family protein [Candidatus Cloacimonadota bacterium]